MLNHNSSVNGLSSEARRSNSFIKTQKQFEENLHHLINGKGLKSDLFPKTVKDLSELGGQLNISHFSPLATHSLIGMTDEKVVELVKYYGLKDPDLKSKVPNLNWFLREIGVTYQYVYRRPFRPFPP
jgi:hypothetical protein